MTSCDYLPILPAPDSPSWMQLSKRLRKLCQTGVPSDPTVFGYKVLKLHNGQYKPHTFCPVSARCRHMPLVLSGITTIGSDQNELCATLYLSSFSVLNMDGRFCFGHINIPERLSDWDCPIIAESVTLSAIITKNGSMLHCTRTI